jgi:hypothetical protein
MAGMPTGGIVSIPNDYDLREISTSTGKYLTFRTQFSDMDYKNNRFFHLYRVAVWLPNDEVEKYKEMIKPGRFFRISGHVTAKAKEENTYDPQVTIVVEQKHLIPTKVSAME